MDDKTLAVGYAAGAVIAMVGVAANMNRDDVVPGYRIPKDAKRRLKALGKSRGWSMAQTAYFCTMIGLDVMEKADKEVKS